MDKNREVLEHCPHFYTIINYEYYSDDLISEKLIDIYERFIFGVDIKNPDNVARIEKLDRVLFKYINDVCFKEQMKNDVMTIKIRRGDNVLESIVNAILSFFDTYELTATRRINITRWI